MPLPDLRPQSSPLIPEERLEHLRNFRLDLKFPTGLSTFSPVVGVAMNDRIDDLDHKAILHARRDPSEHDGVIDAILAHTRASRRR